MADATIAARYITNPISSWGGTEKIPADLAGTGVVGLASTLKAYVLASPTITGHATIEGVTATGATGTGKFVFDGTPTLVTPVLGVATATSINKVTITAPATSAVLTIPDGVTLTGPAASGTAMTLGNAEAVSGIKTFATGQIVNGTLRLGTVSTTTGQLLLANSASANLTTIQAGNAAAARTYTWPTNFGAAGTVLTDAAGNGTLSWAAGGGGSPGGSDTQVQFNDSSAFGGSADFTFDKTNKVITLGDHTSTANWQFSSSGYLVHYTNGTTQNGYIQLDSGGIQLVNTTAATGITMDIGTSSTSTFRVLDNSGVSKLTLTGLGSTVLGSAALATNVTDGFLYVATCAGTPSGTPTSFTGRVALIYDTTAHQFWIYDGGWKQPKTPAGAATVTWQ